MVLNDPSIPLNPDDARIWNIWEEAVGPAIARNARPSWIRDRVLRVRVSGPIWLQELEFAAEAIRDKLNKALGRKAVNKIEFRLGDPAKR
jgi:predicted nucleic acid-binding Zn ribbon protein